METRVVTKSGRSYEDLVPSRRNGCRVKVEVYTGMRWEERAVWESRGTGKLFAIYDGEYRSLDLLSSQGLAGKPRV